MSVKIVHFNCHGYSAPAYGCNIPGDNSGDYVPHPDYAALLARHNALEERVKKINVWHECDQCECLFIPGGLGAETSCATCIKRELDALREAVAWERECCQDIRPLFAWAGLYLRHGEGYVDGVAEDLRAIQDAARAEVDRLIAEAGGDK